MKQTGKQMLTIFVHIIAKFLCILSEEQVLETFEIVYFEA